MSAGKRRARRPNCIFVPASMARLRLTSCSVLCGDARGRNSLLMTANIHETTKRLRKVPSPSSVGWHLLGQVRIPCKQCRQRCGYTHGFCFIGILDSYLKVYGSGQGLIKRLKTMSSTKNRSYLVNRRLSGLLYFSLALQHLPFCNALGSNLRETCEWYSFTISGKNGTAALLRRMPRARHSNVSNTKNQLFFAFEKYYCSDTRILFGTWRRFRTCANQCRRRSALCKYATSIPRCLELLVGDQLEFRILLANIDWSKIVFSHTYQGYTFEMP